MDATISPAKRAESLDHPNRLRQLRAEMLARKLDALILPVTDEYLGEYSPAYARRVTWLCGFDGSAGTLLVLQERAALLVDGRYTLQASAEIDPDAYTLYNSSEHPLGEVLAESLQHGIVGYDPWLHTPQQIEQWRRRLEGREIVLQPLAGNPVDAVWGDQPKRPFNPLLLHPETFAGAAFTEKLAMAAKRLTEEGLSAFVLALPEDLCWLLNLRGSDVPYNPLFLGYGIVHANGQLDLFTDPGKVSYEVEAYLGSHVRFHAPSALEATLAQAAKAGRIGMDPEKTPIAFAQIIEAAGGKPVFAKNPVYAMKAVKNPVEIEGIRRAHLIDGAAVTRFLCWYDSLPDDAHPTELEIVERLARCRELSEHYREPSFATIAGSGPHGAIVHYRATAETDRAIAWSDILLLDSGAQYPFGTTDITRTTARGEVSAMFKERFTLVLKGHIALAQARFPEGTAGGQLDILARQALWQNGLDFDHGTGHGVGAYLCVHEGPQRIAKKGGDAALQPGMVLSNEPGYYQPGEYGIRIENLVLVVDRAKGLSTKDDARRFLGFETLSLAPINTRLIEKILLTDAERAWLNTYHTRVIDQLSPFLDAYESEWLAGHAAMV